MALAPRSSRLALIWLFVVLASLIAPVALRACEEVAEKITYHRAPPAPRGQPGDTAEEQWAGVDAKNKGCVSCHTASDHRTHARQPRGGAGLRRLPRRRQRDHGGPGWKADSLPYVSAMSKAHVLPKYPKSWNWPSSANPKRIYSRHDEGKCGIYPLRQPVGLPRGARSLRGMPHEHHRGVRAFADDHGRDAVGRRGL